jgi:Mn2+/Fe2+ NRAMP family transporter
MIPTNRGKIFAVVILITSLSSGAVAAPRRTTTITDDYRAQYDERREVYCIKFFADLPAAIPQRPCQNGSVTVDGRASM